MVDGLGVPPEGWRNSVFHEHCGKEFTDIFERFSVPVDATLDVPGIPQSATGQCAIFTGVNGAALMNRHVQGFPGPELRKIIRKSNMFAAVLDKGLTPCFANAYVRMTLEELKEKRLRSVTTVMVESSVKNILRLPDLQRDKAVYHDLTRESISPEYDIPEITPGKAAYDLINLASENDLTLFEYFMTDRAGHRRENIPLSKYLSEFSVFIRTLVSALPGDMLLALTSDHGNCEDTGSRSHTTNPVPFLAFSGKLPDVSGVKSILDVNNRLLGLL
jgi:hypothetical protein